MEEIDQGRLKKYAKQPVIMKLSPNVTDITEMAKAAEAGGADAVSLINTLTGMKIDINRKTFALANKTGGVSGPVSASDRGAHGLSGGTGGEACRSSVWVASAVSRRCHRDASLPEQAPYRWVRPTSTIRQ